MTIIKLETDLEDQACHAVNYLYERARAGQVYPRNVLKGLWKGDPWATIKNRMEADGSTWYVWYMDGVRQYISTYLTK